MSYKIRVLSLVLSFFGCAELSAQISGTVIYQASKKPMALVTVSLLNATDSTANTLTVTDPSGRFNFDKIKPGHYTLRFSFIGYRKTDKAIDVAGKKINAGTVEMIMLPKAMNEVTVTAQKSLLNTSIDRKVYNVSQDIMAQSGTASDILKNVPSVEVDIDGNVSLRGSTEVMILINGKPSPLMGKSRAEVLEQLPANAIERIEVISNPSAKFKPDGTSGIINIVLKKNTKAGWNGNVIANAGNRDRYSGAVNLNYKPGKLNLFTGYSWRQDARVRLRDIQRTYFDSAAAIKSYYSENSNSRAHPVSNLITFGADYELNKKNSVGVSGNYRNRDQSKTDAVDKLFYDNNRLLTNAYDRLRDDPEQQVELGGTAYWEHNFPGEDHSIRAEFNASKNHEQEDNHYNNIYRYPTVYSSFDNTLIKQAEQQQQITVD
ncbi:MAG: TonB-dependent receptor, partial [Ferruginibacter sp.]